MDVIVFFNTFIISNDRRNEKDLIEYYISSCCTIIPIMCQHQFYNNRCYETRRSKF